jgi:anthranilate synthase component 1
VCVPAAGKLPFDKAPKADRNLPDMHLSLYNEVVVFDQATKLAYVCVWLHLEKHPSTEHAFLSGKRRIAAITKKLSIVPSLNNAKVWRVSEAE